MVVRIRVIPPIQSSQPSRVVISGSLGQDCNQLFS
jgi:hypothetical protein